MITTMDWFDYISNKCPYFIPVWNQWTDYMDLSDGEIESYFPEFLTDMEAVATGGAMNAAIPGFVYDDDLEWFYDHNRNMLKPYDTGEVRSTVWMFLQRFAEVMPSASEVACG